MTRVLVLRVRGCYFREMQSGVKTLEYRQRTPFWRKRLVGQEYDVVEVWLGYAKADDLARRLRFRWRGFVEQVVQHPHFGAQPVEVFAIHVGDPIS